MGLLPYGQLPGLVTQPGTTMVLLADRSKPYSTITRAEAKHSLGRPKIICGLELVALLLAVSRVYDKVMSTRDRTGQYRARLGVRNTRIFSDRSITC